jgi:hypothetical protein
VSNRLVAAISKRGLEMESLLKGEKVMFRAATVVGKEPFSRMLGKRIGDELVKQLRHKPSACWLFCAPGEGLQDLVSGAFDAAGVKNFIGCTTDGEISTAGFSTASAVIAGIATDQINFQVASVSDISRDGDWAGQQLARELPRTSRHVQLMSDGLTGNGTAIARGMTSVLGFHVPISGGAAGDARKFKQTWQFIGNKVLTDSAVAIAMTGNFQIGTGIRSGWFPVGAPKKVTRARGNVVFELDGESALAVYRRYLGPLATKLPAVGVQFPFGMVDESLQLGEDPILRAPMSLDEREGSVTFAGEVPEGVTLTLATGGLSDNLLEASAEAARRAMTDLGDSKPAMIFFYSCMARKILLGPRTGEETSRIADVVGHGAPIAGFYTYGEFCPSRRDSGCLLHNETATVTVIGLPPDRF